MKGHSAFIAVVIALLVSCSPGNKRLEQALQFAGNNRGELEKVLTYYKNSGQKYEAACFLIENMPQYYAYQGRAIDSAKAALATVGIYFKEEGFVYNWEFGLPHLGVSYLWNHHVGTCSDACDLTLYVEKKNRFFI